MKLSKILSKLDKALSDKIIKAIMDFRTAEGIEYPQYLAIDNLVDALRAKGLSVSAPRWSLKDPKYEGMYFCDIDVRMEGYNVHMQFLYPIGDKKKLVMTYRTIHEKKEYKVEFINLKITPKSMKTVLDTLILDDVQQFEKLLKGMDWTYQFSDDFRYYASGEARMKQIKEMIKKLPKDVSKNLWLKYAPKDWKFESLKV